MTFAEVKTDSPSTILLHALWKILQSSVSWSQHGLTNVLQASYAICGSQNELSKLFEASYIVCGSQNTFFDFQQAYNTIREIQKRPFGSYTSLLHASRKSKPTLTTYGSQNKHLQDPYTL